MFCRYFIHLSSKKFDDKNRFQKQKVLIRRLFIVVLCFLTIPQCVFAQKNDTLRYKSYLFISQPIPQEVQARMQGKSMPIGAKIGFDELRYLTVFHYDFDGNIQQGELVCNKAIASDLLYIFRALFIREYPICSIRLIDDFDADDEASMQANNTSCFNYRRVPGTKSLSKHAFGMAVDINPLQNPYIQGSKVHPRTAEEYVDRNRVFPHKIDENDYCTEVFESYGFRWGGRWSRSKDYQHFYKPK
ncbi:MAG: M15 family metallopeptidase [Bacteroidales bacterium]|nr:M15 family metallopeptidase [Bacteroidales bacterium]